jgi:hypothetical protein
MVLRHKELSESVIDQITDEMMDHMMGSDLFVKAVSEMMDPWYEAQGIDIADSTVKLTSSQEEALVNTESNCRLQLLALVLANSL